MKKEEVIKWLMIMKANLNSFPEVSKAKKIEALREAIRLLKNEQSIDKIDCEHTECRNCINHKYCDYESSSSEIPNKSIEEKCPCYHCEYFEIKGWSHCKIHEDAYGDSRCNDYRKANQGSNKVNQGLNKSEIPTGSDDCISREQALRELKESAEHHANDSREEVLLRRDRDIIRALPPVTPIRPKGHWILTDVEGNRVWHCNCSECGKDPQNYVGGSENWWLIKSKLPKFCPSCGSDNREVGDV